MYFPRRKLAMLIFASASCAFPQESVNYGSIGGRVTDPSGAVVQNARVTATQSDTNQTTSTTTDREGRFRFAYLRGGEYALQVASEGFETSQKTLNVSAGSAFEVPISLKLNSARSNVTVHEDSTILEAARSQIAGTVSQKEASDLPLNGRNYLDLALLIPGVSSTNTASNQLFAETSAVPGQGISVGSQRNFSNNFVVDGLSANDDAAGLTGAYYGLDVVNEFQVVTSGGQAEFGRALGGYVNVVTKSGTNRVHGDLYGYFRNSRFNASNALSHTVLPLTQMQYGASIGGPAVHDRTFYFANFEQRELNQSGLITIASANVTAINDRLAATGYPGPAIFTGLYPNPVHNTNVLAKVDHDFSARDRLSLRYALYKVNSQNSRGAGGLSAASASADLHDTDQIVSAGNIAAFSPRLVNETRAQFTRSNLSAPPSDPVGPAVSIAGVASLGTLSSSPVARLNDLDEIADNLSYQTGAHAIRVGFDFLYNDDNITFPRSIRGSYSFSSLAAFLAGTYNNSGFTQTFNRTNVAQTNPNVGFYVQDEWKPNSRLTLNLGVRYDLQFLNTIATDTNNVSPRAGFAWSPFASRNTIIRGSYGLFYDRIPLRALANALLSANNTVDPAQIQQVTVSLSPGQTGAPAFPSILGSLMLPPGVLFNFTTMDRRIKNAYSEQGSFEIERRVGASGVVTAGYEHLRGLQLIASINQNVPACIAAGNNNACRPNTAFGNDSQYSAAGDSRYDALNLSFVQHPSAWGSYRISYSWSKALDDVGEFFFSAPIDNFNIWLDYGRSDDDQRHRIVFDGTLHLPNDAKKSGWQRIVRGFQLSGMLQYYSALPLNITTGANTIQGTAARPTINGIFIGRNAGTGAEFFNVNARLSRTFPLGERLKLEAIAEAFNLFNHVNPVTLNGIFGTGVYPSSPAPTFRQLTAVSDSRSMQFALRLNF
jgi:outer membrane receptor protein involved in Fe transport